MDAVRQQMDMAPPAMPSTTTPSSGSGGTRRASSVTALSMQDLPSGPAYIAGSIYRAMSFVDGSLATSAARIGTFRATGWIFDPRRGPKGGILATQTFDMRGRGKIVTCGLLDERVGVTAGTGDYREAHGQADMAWLTDSAFRIWFDIATP
jgi:hypothetical protein